MLTLNKLEYGDYQTPLDFCEQVIDIIGKTITPDIVFEPTFGLGHFLEKAIKKFKKTKKFIGNEINKDYYNLVLNKYKNDNIILFNQNIFDFNHSKILKNINKYDNLLILGNPPWVTNSKLSNNLPKKDNFKNLKGIDAITGSSNFDICEYIITDLLKSYKSKNTTLAMLCKTSVVTNIIKSIDKYDFKLKNNKMYLFDAKKIFKIDCEACLFITNIDTKGEDFVSVYDIDNKSKLLYQFGYKNNKFFSKFENLEFDIDGKFKLEWRQGVKHDCSKIMEIKKLSSNTYINKLNQEFKLEDKYVYELLKSSDLKENIINNSNKYVIITQKHIRQDTQHIKNDAFNTWEYLNLNKDYFNKRKSTIYKNCPDFSIFGIGDYSFSKYKVAISGFYKSPNFVFIDSFNKSIMLDDTCYF